MPTIEFTSQEAALFRGMQKIIAQQKKMEGGFKRVGTEGKKAGKKVQKGFDPKKVAAFAAQFGGVSGAIGVVTKGIEAWNNRLHETEKAVSGAARSFIAFAALQEKGTKAAATERAIALGTSFGLTDIGQITGTVQSLQSARGSLDAGLKDAGVVFAAKDVGIPVESGTALERFGASQGAPIGEFLRLAYVAGRESSQSPAAIALAGPALREFQDKRFGFSVAGTLAGALKEGTTIETAVKRVGFALSSLSSPAAQATFRRLGVQDKSGMQKAHALAAAGIDTTEELGAAGFTPERASELSTVVSGIELQKKIYRAERRDAVPGLFPRERALLESEIPSTGVQREIDFYRANAGDAIRTRPTAQADQKFVREEALTFAAMRRTSNDTIMGFSRFDETGKRNVITDIFAEVLLNAVTGFGSAFEVEREKERLRAEARAVDPAGNEKIVNVLEDISAKLGPDAGGFNIQPDTHTE